MIDADAGTGQALARALHERGYAVDLCAEAMAGFRNATGSVPDCIVCSPELPDIDGAWVARRVRTEGGPLSNVPFLFVGPLSAPKLRVQLLNVGADVFLARPPASNDDVVAQVDALVGMFHRLAGADAPSSVSMSAAIRGDLSAFPLASVLMMFEMERRSGLVDVVAESGRRASLTLTHGLFANTELGGAARPALEVLREVLSWRTGRFAFVAREGSMLPPPRASVGALVLEAMRLEDEEKAPRGAPAFDLDDGDGAPESMPSVDVLMDDLDPIEGGEDAGRRTEPKMLLRVPPRPKAVS